MSEMSGPAGQGKLPSKPKTPTPSPTYWDPFEGARNQASPVPYTVPPTSVWTTGGNVSTSSVREREGYMGVYSTSRFTWHPNQDGTISSTDAMKQNTVIGASAILGDYGNRKNPWLTNSDTLYDIPGAVAAWVNQNTGKDVIGKARARLISLGRISGEDAKITGNGIDPALLNALNGAVYDISITNYNRIAVGEDLLTLDEGLLSLSAAPATTTGSGSGFGGTSTRITRQEFKPEDYRIAVDKAYRDITGQAASDSTLNTYIQVLQKLEEANPMKQVAKTTGTAQNNTTVVKETGGVSQDAQEDILLKQAIAEPETEYYQKATTFMDYFNEAIKAKVDL